MNCLLFLLLLSLSLVIIVFSRLMRLPLDWSCPRDGLDLPSRILITGVVGERTIYSATELDGLAVVDCIDHFTPYMSVTTFF